MKLKKKKKPVEKAEAVRFNPSLESGLSYGEIEHRKRYGEVNVVKNTTEKTYFQIIFNNVFSFFNILMFAIAFVLVAFVGLEVILNLTFLFIAIVNTAIGTVQECKSKKAIKKLKLLSESTVKVIRNGYEEEIYSEEIVLDDILILKAGDEIPADCIIMENKTVEVNESLLTGESRAVRKTLADRLYAGSFIISGSARVKVDAIGEATYIHSIEEKTKVFKKPKAKIVVSIDRIIKMLAYIAVPLAIVVALNQLFALGPEGYKDIIKNSCLTIPYMIPAGMLLLSSVSMMSGVISLAKKKVLAQDLASVEALSRIDTLCLDKTGTLTDGTMTVERTIVNVSPSGLFEGKDNDVEAIISSYMGAFETANQTSKAIIEKYGNEVYLKAKEVLEFSSARKYSAVRFENDELYVLGAPEYIDPDNESTDKLIKDFSEKGSRVVVLAHVMKGDIEEDTVKMKKVRLVATFIIRDNIRPEVPETMEWFRENGVDIKVISGDNVGTVSYIARFSGIENWDKCVDMSKVSDDEYELKRLVLKNTVFARVTPEQKAKIVDILKEAGRTVAMTGDGVNDIIALKKADCSIALANGAPATKNISNLVLLDSNFSNMKEAVFEGRRVVNNVQRSSTLFVMKDFLWMFITIWPILFGFNFDLEPTVMTVVNLFITGFGSFCLALEPDRRRIEGNFMRNVIGTGIVSGFYMFLPVICVYIYSAIYCNFDITAMSAYIRGPMFPVISICIAIAGFVIFYKICCPFTKFRRILFGGVFVLVVALLLLIPNFFLMNGTDFMNAIIDQFGRGVLDIAEGMIKSIFNLEIYRTLAFGQWVIILLFFGLSTLIYKATDKIVSKYLKITMFNPHRFDD